MVEDLIEWVRQEYDQAVILADTSIYPCTDRPPRIGGYVPDLYARVALPTRLVLGEAKTPLDLDNHHTKSQLVAFLGFCHLHPLSHFVMAVPWDMSARAHNMLRQVISENGFCNVTFTVRNCYVY